MSTVSQLAAIPEEDIWLAKQKSAHAARLPARRPALHEDTGHHDAGGAAPGRHQEVIAWERHMRETEHAASTIRRRLAALSSLYKHLVSATITPRATTSAY
jgi:integrase/recombinase XerD